MEHCEQYPDPRTKGERPSQRVDEQRQIARVTDGAVDAALTNLWWGWMATNPLNR
jgi:hypothetical protein